MSRWFRHYAGMMRDDKLVSAAIRSKQAVERVVWIWGAILESASEINDDGLYRLDCAEVAYFLRADEADIRAVLDALTDAGRVAEGRVVKWSDRQFKSDQSAERQARYRDKKRGEVRDSDDQQTSGDGGVTLQSPLSDAPETKTELETEDKPPASLLEPARALFDQVWEAFPRNPTSPEPAAEAAFNATKAEDRPLILAAALRYRAWFLEDCVERKRTETAGEKFQPFLAKWISTGDWRQAAALPLKAEAGKPSPDLVVIRADTPEFEAIKRLRGKPPIVGDRGTTTVTKTELAEALAA